MAASKKSCPSVIVTVLVQSAPFTLQTLSICWPSAVILSLFFSEACGNKVDPVYEALRFGTSLAQKAKRPSGSESPQRDSVRNDY